MYLRKLPDGASAMLMVDVGSHTLGRNSRVLARTAVRDPVSSFINRGSSELNYPLHWRVW
jgi:hypothetical protein